MDYDALAKQFGGVVASTTGSEGMPGNRQPAAVDYDALAKQFGGVSAVPEKPRRRGVLKNQPEMEEVRIPTLAEVGQQWKETGIGALEGIPSAIVGLPGDVVGIVADNPYTSQEFANYMFGAPTSPYQAGGRMFGGALTGFGTPGIAARIGTAKQAVTAANYPNIARALGTPQAVLDPVTAALQGGGAVVARALGATQTVLDPITAALQGGSAVVQKGVDIANKLSPTRRMMTQAVGPDAEQIVSALRAPGTTFVPGTQPTVGEITAGAGVGNTQLAALQTRLARDPELASKFAAREATNELARIKSIGTIAPEIPADLATAEKARAAQASLNYGRIETKLVPPDETLTALLETPAMQEAVATAKNLAANNRRPFMTEANEYPGQSLLDIKAGMDKMLTSKRNAVGGALEAAELKTIGKLRGDYIDWLEGVLPGFKTAKTEFAASSKPIDVMDVGKILKESVTSPLDQGISRPAMLAQAVRNAPGTIKKATGAPRYEDLSAVLETADSAKISNVLSDFARSEEFRRLSQATASVKAGESVADIPGARGVIGTLASGIMKAFENAISRKAAVEIGEAMLQPETFARLVEKYAIPNAPRNIMERNARRLATQERNVRRNNLLRGGVQSSNALAPQEAP
jgi:hypothetical protein